VCKCVKLRCDVVTWNILGVVGSTSSKIEVYGKIDENIAGGYRVKYSCYTLKKAE